MGKNTIPKWKLEWYLRGALPEKEQRAIAALERSDAGLRGRIDALRASDAEIMAKSPPPTVKAISADVSGSGDVCSKLRMELRSEPRTKSAPACKPGTVLTTAPVNVFRLLLGDGGVPRWAVPALACVALVAVIPVWMSMTGRDGLRPQQDDAAAYGTRVKGDADVGMTLPSLEVWRKTGSDAEMLEPDAPARAGDIVQLRYIVPEPCYGALVSMDGRGVLTVHLSGGDGKAALLTPGRPVALKTSYKLDDAPAFEAFYLITASEKFDMDSVALSLKKINHPINNDGDGYLLSIPQKNRVTTFTLRKSDIVGMN